MNVSLLKLTKLRIDLDSFIRILQGFRERHQFHVRCGSIVVASGVTRIALDALSVILNCACEVAGLELCVSFLACGCALFWVDVRSTVLFSLLSLDFAELVEDVGSTVFRQRLLEVLDSLSKVALLLISRTDTSQSFSNEFVIGTKLKRFVLIFRMYF